MSLPDPPPIRIPLAWPYNSRQDTSARENVDVRRVNVMDEPKVTEEGLYTLKRPGLETSAIFSVEGNGQALLYYNGTFFGVVGDYLQSITLSPTGATGAAWTTVTAAPWAQRVYAQTVVLENVMYVIGGLAAGIGAAADVWWTTDGQQWTQATGSAPFGGVYQHGAVVCNGRIYTMGGLTLAGPVNNQVWSSKNGTDWVQETASAEWSARLGMGLVATSNGIFLFGGIDITNTALDDIWFSVDGKKWTEINGGTHWSGRAFMMCYNYQNKLFIAGGQDGSAGASFDDCWSSSDGGQTWAQLTTSAFSVSHLSMAGYCVYANKMWAINGRIDISTRSNHVYSSTDGITWTNVTSSGPGAAAQGGNAVVFGTPSTYGYESIWFMGGNSGSSYFNIPYYGTLNVTPSLAIPLSPPVASQPFQLNTFVEGQKLLVKNQSALWVYDHGTVVRVTDKGYPPQTVPGLVVVGRIAYVLTPGALIRWCLPDDPYHWESRNALGADFADDPGVALAKYNNYVVAFGTYTTQFFYLTGAPSPAPVGQLAPYLLSNMNIGCAAAATVAEVGNTLVWVSQSKQLHRQVVFLNGLQPQVISTPYIEKILGGQGTLSAISASVEGHLFYILSFAYPQPSLVYDFSVKQWYEWSTLLTVIPPTVEGPWSFPAFTMDAMFKGSFVLGPYNGLIYRLRNDVFTDAGALFQVKIQTPKIDGGNNRQKFWGQLELIGDRVPNNLTSFVTIEYSDDDYQTWSTGRDVDLNLPRPVLYRNGAGRRRAFRLTKQDNLIMRLEALEQTVEQGQ